jgi:hypothetical protein
MSKSMISISKLAILITLMDKSMRRCFITVVVFEVSSSYSAVSTAHLHYNMVRVALLLSY